MKTLPPVVEMRSSHDPVDVSGVRTPSLTEQFVPVIVGVKPDEVLTEIDIGAPPIMGGRFEFDGATTFPPTVICRESALRSLVSGLNFVGQTRM